MVEPVAVAEPVEETVVEPVAVAVSVPCGGSLSPSGACRVEPVVATRGAHGSRVRAVS